VPQNSFIAKTHEYEAVLDKKINSGTPYNYGSSIADTVLKPVGSSTPPPPPLEITIAI